MEKDKTGQLPALDDGTFFRYVYMPMLLVEIIWDYADSVINLAAQMRIQSVKRLSYVIRELCGQYQYKRSKHISFEQRAKQRANMEAFQDSIGPEIDKVFSSLKRTLTDKRPHLNGDWIYFLSTVYLASILISTFKAYARYSVVKLREKYDKTPGTLIPIEIWELGKLIPEYLGDHDNILEQKELETVALKFIDIIQSTEFEGNFLQDAIELPDISKLAAIAANAFHVEGHDILKSRSKAAVLAQAAMVVVLKKEFNLSDGVIGNLMHHTAKTIFRLEKLAEKQNLKSDGRIGLIIREMSKSNN